jgi:hypothetical protein
VNLNVNQFKRLQKKFFQFPKTQAKYTEADFPYEVVPGLPREHVAEFIRILKSVRTPYNLAVAKIKISNINRIIRNRQHAENVARRAQEGQEGGSSAT